MVENLANPALPAADRAGTRPVPHQQIQDLIGRKEYTRAQEMLQQRLKADPKDADTFYLLGVNAYFQGRIGETIEQLRKALAIDARHTDAAICLSVLYNDIGKYDEAKRVFEQANQSVAYRGSTIEIGIDRKFAVKHLELADLYFRYRRYDEAIEEYGKAALLDPTALDIRIRRAKSFAKKGFLTRAIQELQQLKRENPRYVPARIQLGLLHYSQQNLLDAELEWEGALDVESTNREALAYLEMARRGRPQN